LSPSLQQHTGNSAHYEAPPYQQDSLNIQIHRYQFGSLSRFYYPLAVSHRQADAIYFDLSSAFDLIPHTLLLDNLSAFGISGDYVN
jgi:hypothetical protein